MREPIKILSPMVANQIAAGEVIERPSSIVKELIENSCDAGALEISVDLYYGGLNRIIVRDNGSGIPKEELKLAITAHATSKLGQISDLLSLTTMGFRGEALASIASISKLKIISRPNFQEFGAGIEILSDGTLEEFISPHNEGTTVDVREIFHNTPVRKKFLRTPKYEYLMIENLLKKFALSAPWIKINFLESGKLVWSLPAAKKTNELSLRIAKIFSKKFINDAYHFNVSEQDINIEAWIGSLSLQKSQNDNFWIYLNHRMVKDKFLNHIIRKIYEPYLNPGKYPVGVLYIDLDPAKVDFNVHPTKCEVRFEDPRLIHDVLMTLFMKIPFFSCQKQDINLNPVANKIHVGHEIKNNIVDKDYYTIINQNLGLTIIDAKIIIFEIKKMSELVIGEINKIPIPWPSRKLLVPYKVTIEDLGCSELCEFYEKKKYWQLYGVTLDYIDATQQISIKSIPNFFPQLDVLSMMRGINITDFLNHAWFYFFEKNYLLFTKKTAFCKIIDSNNIFSDGQVAE